MLLSVIGEKLKAASAKRSYLINKINEVSYREHKLYGVIYVIFMLIRNTYKNVYFSRSYSKLQ